jgi:hypothetical protein
VRDWWRGRLTQELSRLRNDGPSALQWSLRVTVAATASYVVGTLFFPGTQPLLAPLTAMLVVQVTPVSLLTAGLDRVLAVVSGVSLAVAFSVVVPLQWWSLGLLIFAAITIGQVLRLRNNLVEVAISGMLVLGVGSLAAEAAAWQRLAETLVGAAVGIATNLVFPPKVASADAGDAIDGLADSVSDLLNRAADELATAVEEGHDVSALAGNWLGEARRITHDIPRIGAALLRAEQGRRLNVRAVGTPDVGPGLRQGLESLEHSAIAIRAMFRSLFDATREATWLDDEGAREMLLDVAQCQREMADGIDAFGQLVHDEAVPGQQMTAANVRTLRDALDGLREARTRLDETLVAGAASPEQLELHAAVLSTVKRLQGELDLDERIRRQVRMLRQTRQRSPQRSAGQGSGPASQAAAAAEPVEDAETQLLPQLPDDRRRKRRP